MTSKLKIVCDVNICDVSELFGRYGDIKFLPGRNIDRSHVAQADALLVRTITQVNRELLEQTSVRFVGSATSGIDHIDVPYLKTNNIVLAHSPGSNANAVVQYDMSVFAKLKPEWRTSTIGIIGCGRVGGRLHALLKKLNVKLRVYDPFLTQAQVAELTDLDKVLKSDIVCVHTPLTHSGQFPTANLLDEQKINTLSSGTLLVNAGRGGVVDEAALIRRLDSKNDISVAFDVWDSEPLINLSLMSKINIATPHIAGYTFEAKKQASQMLLDAFLLWQGKRSPSREIELKEKIIHLGRGDEAINDLILACYDVSKDDEALRHAMSEGNFGVGFDYIRNDYPFRHDFQYYAVRSSHRQLSELRALGFKSI
jgi:erythronate-4-phosphate dehydrogenase